MIIKSGVVEQIFQQPGPWHYAILDERSHLYSTVEDWCMDNFGIEGSQNWFVSIDRSSYFFKKEEDFILFVLRWS